MKNKLFPTKKFIELAPLLAFTAVLASCGGGGGDDTSLDDPIDNPAVGSPSEDPDATPSALPDFSIVDIAASTTITHGKLRLQVTITNTGDAAGLVPAAWLTVSADPDASSGYQHTEVSLAGVEGQSTLLKPGETGVFDAGNQQIGVISARMASVGTYYGQLWLNPDLSERYLNPEPNVVASHSVEELDYKNNKSDLVAFENTTGGSCDVDAYEENDTEALATVIVTNRLYNFNACDEAFEILALDASKGTTYEIKQSGSTTWDLRIIDPDGKYIMKGGFGSLLTPTVSGRYLIVAQTTRSLYSLFDLEVVEQ